ncbi:MAG: zinc dependent phospholipase C family protein [Candidatus Riflebacteria bacterium]|nr:zinc dependent phospholipase C family protein [Candidatus Riflebacteria bacterium]
MPASIAHMLIAETVRTKGSLDPKFQNALNENAHYMALGALGPDLPYYESLVGSEWSILLDRSDKPMGVVQWSYQMHSKDPNIFPLKMLEGIWRDAGPQWDQEDRAKFAFVCGFLTHMAADQIIHPLVNSIAGPYYKRGCSRTLHREAEVYQDVILYKILKDSDLLEATPHIWCDLNPGWGANVELWLVYMIQKAFVEAHAVSPTEKQIESWVTGILAVLRGITHVGKYVDATKDFKSNGNKSKLVQNYWSNHNYMEEYFQPAVDLANIYMNVACELYHKTDWNAGYRTQFLDVVRNVDLSAPLEENILANATANFDKHFNSRSNDSFSSGSQ